MEDPLDFIAFGYVPGGVALVCFYVWVGFGNEEEDYALDVWAGVLPMRQVFGELVVDPLLKDGVDVPQYITDYAASRQ